MLAGGEINHTFEVRNNLLEPVAIKDAADVKTNCGCSAVEPAARVLEPGQATGVTLTIRTAGRQGVLTNGGTVVWTSASGQRRTMAFTIRVVVRPAMEPSVAALVFEDEDVRTGAVKELAFAETIVPMNWDTVKVATSAPFEIMATTRTEKGVRCTVKCIAREDLEDAKGEVVAVGQSLPKVGEAPSTWTASVPVAARRTPDLIVAPRSVPLAVDAEGRGKARLLIRGRRLTGQEQPIVRVACTGYRVKWDVVRSSAGGPAVVQLDFTSTGEKIAERPEVTVEVRGAPPVRLPLVVMAKDKGR